MTDKYQDSWTLQSQERFCNYFLKRQPLVTDTEISEGTIISIIKLANTNVFMSAQEAKVH